MVQHDGDNGADVHHGERTHSNCSGAATVVRRASRRRQQLIGHCLQSPANTLGEEFNTAADTLDFVCTVFFTCVAPPASRMSSHVPCPLLHACGTSEPKLRASWLRLECIMKILAFGLYWESDYTYLKGNWNLLDFFVVVCGWVYILFFEDSEASGAATGHGIKPNVFRCVRALRPLRAMRFFAGLSAVLTAIGSAGHLILEVGGFLCFFFAIFSAMGISLFKGALTYRCEDFFLAEYVNYDEEVLAAMLTDDSIMDSYFMNMSIAGATYHECPDNVERPCGLCAGDSVWTEFIVNGKENPLASKKVAELLGGPVRDMISDRYKGRCCRVITSETAVSGGLPLPYDDPDSAERYDDRVNDVDLYGFDNLFAAVLSEYVATTMDEWPALSHPLANSDSYNRSVVWIFFAFMTLTLAVLTGNLFVSVICYAFGQLQISEDNSAAALAAVAQLRAMFNRFDSDQSGQIGAEEVGAIAASLGVTLNAAEIEQAMATINSDHTGGVDFEEFYRWWDSGEELAIRMKRGLATEEHKLKDAFRKCDTDRGGSLDQQELANMGNVLGISLTEDETAEMFMELDARNTNDIDFAMFTAWWFAGSAVAMKVKAAFNDEDVKIRMFFEQCVDTSTNEISFKTMENFGSNLNLTFTKPELLQAMEEMDEDQGGTVNEEEFAHWWKSGSKIASKVRKKLQEEEAAVRVLFGRLDEDNSGKLERQDMKTIGDSIGLDMNEKRLDTMMSEMDDDGSGEVDAGEFLSWWTSESVVAAELKKALEPFLMAEAAPKFPANLCPAVSILTYKLISAPVFDWCVLSLVIVNAIFMASDRYPMTESHHGILFSVEVIFAMIYSIEATLKIIAYGFQPYWQNGFNKMDFIIVGFSIVGLIVPKFEGLAALRGLRVLVKMLRVLRVFKLLSKYDTVMMLLKTVMGAWKMLTNLVVFIVFILTLFAVAGMHTVGTCHLCTADSTPACPKNVYGMVVSDDNATLLVDLRENYFDFSSSLITTFQIMSGEDWAPIMYKYMHCAGTPAVFFFCILFAVSNFMMLNLFVAVILMNFELAEEEKLIKQENQYMREVEANGKTDAEKNSALMWLRHRKDRADPNKLEAMDNIRAGIRKAHGEAGDDDGSGWNRAVVSNYEGEDTSLFCLTLDHPFRKVMISIGDSKAFDIVTLIIIVAASVALALDKPHNAASVADGVAKDPLDDPLVIFNIVVTVYFVFEFLIKVFAYGFLFTPRAYIVDPWNAMDFTVLLISAFDAIMTLMGEATNEWTRILRLLRILRPLRMIKHAEGMKVIINALIKCGPMVFAVMVLNMVFYLIFATLGVGMFKGQFRSCVGVPGQPSDWTELPHYDDSTNTPYTEVLDYQGVQLVSTGKLRLVESESDLNQLDCTTLGGSWSNPPYNFDNVFQAFKALFIVSTLEGWIDVMHAGMDCAGEGNAPIRDNQFNNFLFFWMFVILGAYFVTNIFVGVMVNFFSESSGSGLLTQAQKQWQMKQIMCLSVKSRVTVLPEPGLRRKLYDFAVSAPMEYFIQLCIVLNTLVMIAEHYPEDPDLTETFHTLNLIFLVIFTVEACIKVYALGITEYLHDNWCVLDGTIVLMSWLFRLSSQSGASALRSLRILRIILLLKHAPNLRSLFGTLILSLPPCLNLTTLMTMVFFMWGVVGIQFFGELPWGDVQTRRDLCDEVRPDLSKGGWPNPMNALPKDGDNAALTECNWDNECGALGPPQCWKMNAWDGNLNNNDNFDSILNAVPLLVQISTGQDWMVLCQEIADRLNEIQMAEEYGAISNWPTMRLPKSDYGGSTNDMISFFYFMSFYVAAVFVFLNLFVAVLLENFEMNFESELLDLNVAHVEEFKQIWTQVTEGPRHDSIHISGIRTLVETIRDNPSPKSPASTGTQSDGASSPRTPRSSKRDRSVFVRVLDDANWFNRLMFELGCTPDDVNSDMTIGFHQLLLGLTLLQHTYEGLGYKENMRKLKAIENRTQEYARHVIVAYVRCWIVCKRVPEVDTLGREYKTEARRTQYRLAARCAREMVVDSAIRTNKLLKAAELQSMQ